MGGDYQSLVLRGMEHLRQESEELSECSILAPICSMMLAIQN